MRSCGSKTPRRSRHTATGRPSWLDRTGERRAFLARTAHKSGVNPTGARYPKGKRPDRPRAAWRQGYAPAADSAAVPRAGTFCHQTHSSWLSTAQEDEGSGDRERYYRLRAPARQLWTDKPDNLFRGQPPRAVLSICLASVRVQIKHVGRGNCGAV